MSEKNFIETVDTILKERSKLVNRKREQETELENSIKTLKRELAAAKTEYSNKFTEETLTRVKEISRQIKEKQVELEDVQEDIEILKSANHIDYSPEEILREVDNLITESGILSEIEEIETLATTLKEKYNALSDKWESVRWDVHKFSGKVNKLKLNYSQRVSLVNSIENKSNKVYSRIAQCHRDIKESSRELPWAPSYGMHSLKNNPYEE